MAGSHYGPPSTELADKEVKGRSQGEYPSISERESGVTERNIVNLAGKPRRPLVDSRFDGMDMDALTRESLRSANPVTRRLAFARLLESLTPENASAMRAGMLALGADADQWRDFHYQWGAVDGGKAMANAIASPEADTAATLMGFASANPMAAIALLEQFPADMRNQPDLLSSLVAGLAQGDPTAAAAFVASQEGARKDQAAGLMEVVAGEAIKALGAAGAAEWTETLAPGPLKGNAMARISGEMVRQDPQVAAAWAERYADRDYASRAVEQVGAGWAASDPVAAVGWLASLPSGSGQTAGLRTAFGDWEDRDPAAAGDYLFAMEKTPQRDSAISGFAAGYAWQDPQTAIAWANAIGDADLRQTSLTRVGRAFYRRDPEGARAWLPTSGLSPAAQQEAMTR